jgi:hypothetical protein
MTTETLEKMLQTKVSTNGYWYECVYQGRVFLLVDQQSRIVGHSYKGVEVDELLLTAIYTMSATEKAEIDFTEHYYPRGGGTHGIYLTIIDRPTREMYERDNDYTISDRIRQDDATAKMLITLGLIAVVILVLVLWTVSEHFAG